MLQARSQGIFNGYDNRIIRYYDRNKLTIKYEASKRVSLYVAEEIYIPLNDPEIKVPSRSRSFVGTLINITKHQQLDLFFMYQKQLRVTNWYKQDISYPYLPLVQKFVYGIGYTIDF
jgi:hypothetical protein